MMNTLLLVMQIMYGFIVIMVLLTLIFEKRSITIRRYFGDVIIALISPILLLSVCLIYVLFKLNLDKPALWLNNVCDKITFSLLSN